MIDKNTEKLLIQDWIDTWGGTYGIYLKSDDFFTKALNTVNKKKKRYPYKSAMRDLQIIIYLKESVSDSTTLLKHIEDKYELSLKEDKELLRNSSSFGDTAVYAIIALMLGTKNGEEYTKYIRDFGRYNTAVVLRLERVLECI